MSAQAILEKRMAEVNARQSSRKAAQAAFISAYPDVRAWLADWREAGCSVTVSAFDYAIHGPMRKDCPDYPATMGSHNDAPKSGKGRR